MVTIVVHVVWCTYRRRKVISLGRDAALHATIIDAARALRCDVIAAGNADDHVHVLVRLERAIPLSVLVQRMKGCTSHAMHLRWQRAYYAESVTPTESDALAAYVARQRVHHDHTHPIEIGLAD